MSETEIPPEFADATAVHSDELGTVYRTLGRRSGGDVAVTVLRVVVAERSARRRLRAELLAAQKLVAHPHVLALHRADFTEGHRPFIVTAAPPLESLADRLARRGPLPVGQAARLLCDVADALAAAHAEGVLHLDLRPAAVFVDSGDRAVVAGFGVLPAVQQIDPAAVPPTRMVHAARELFGWETPGPASDAHGLASLLYELLAGRAAYAQEARLGRAALYQRVLRGDPPPIPRTDVPPALTDLITSLMAPDAARRPTIADARTALATVASLATERSVTSRFPVAPPQPPMPPPPPVAPPPTVRYPPPPSPTGPQPPPPLTTPPSVAPPPMAPSPMAHPPVVPPPVVPPPALAAPGPTIAPTTSPATRQPLAHPNPAPDRAPDATRPPDRPNPAHPAVAPVPVEPPHWSSPPVTAPPVPTSPQQPTPVRDTPGTITPPEQHPRRSASPLAERLAKLTTVNPPTARSAAPSTPPAGDTTDLISRQSLDHHAPAPRPPAPLSPAARQEQQTTASPAAPPNPPQPTVQPAAETNLTSHQASTPGFPHPTTGFAPETPQPPSPTTDLTLYQAQPPHPAPTAPTLRPAPVTHDEPTQGRRRPPRALVLLVALAALALAAGLVWGASTRPQPSAGGAAAPPVTASASSLTGTLAQAYQPTAVAARPGGGGILVSWQSPQRNDGVSAFVVTAAQGTAVTGQQTIGAAGRSVAFTGLTPGQEYCFVVATVVQTSPTQAGTATAPRICATAPLPTPAGAAAP